MRNHVRQSRSVRTSATSTEGHERDLVLAPTGFAAEDGEDAEDAGAVDDPDSYPDGVTRIDAAGIDDADDDDTEDDLADVVRLACPDCARPIAVAGDDVVLPPHAVCPNPWQPFGLTVCAGSGRAVADAASLEPLVVAPTGEQFTPALPVLPTGFDWRTQPFSHVGGPGSRPISVPLQREARPLAA